MTTKPARHESDPCPETGNENSSTHTLDWKSTGAGPKCKEIQCDKFSQPLGLGIQWLEIPIGEPGGGASNPDCWAENRKGGERCRVKCQDGWGFSESTRGGYGDTDCGDLSLGVDLETTKNVYVGGCDLIRTHNGDTFEITMHSPDETTGSPPTGKEFESTLVKAVQVGSSTGGEYSLNQISGCYCNPHKAKGQLETLHCPNTPELLDWDDDSRKVEWQNPTTSGSGHPYESGILQCQSANFVEQG